MERISNFFKKALKKLRLADGLSMCLAVLVLAGTIAVVPVGASGHQVASNVGGQDVTLLRFSQIITQAFSHNMSAAQGKSIGTTLGYIKAYDTTANGMSMGNIGNVLGILGDDESDNAGNVWEGGTDNASKLFSLSTLSGFYGQSKASSYETSNTYFANSLISQYIVFGSALANMGIDEFRDAQSNADGVRTIIGYTCYVFYILAYSASGIMKSVVGLMQRFNIFKAFYDAAGSTITTLAGLLPAGSGTNKFLLEVQKIYLQLRKLRWVIFGLSIVIIVASVTIWKGKGYNQAATIQNRWRKLLYRFVIMIIGIPLIGMVYTECLNLIAASADDTSYAVTNYIFQEFLDFEGWTVNKNDFHGNRAFQVDGSYGKELQVQFNTATRDYTFLVDGKEIDMSKFVYSANIGAACDDTGKAVISENTQQKFLSDIFDSSTSTSDYSDILDTSGTGIVDVTKAYQVARNLLLRYARSATVLPDSLTSVFSYDYQLLGQYGGWDSEEADVGGAVVEQLFGEQSAHQRIWSFVSKEALNIAESRLLYKDDVNGMAVPLGHKDGGDEISVILNGVALAGTSGNSYTGVTANGVKLGSGTIMRSTLRNGIVTDSSADDSSTINTSAASAKGKVANSGGLTVDYTYNLANGGMSPLALYNYMHTMFDDGAAYVYNPERTSNAGVGMMHYSVTTPYSGIPEIIQILYVICILFSVGIIGWAFGISLLMNTIVQTIKALPIMFKVILGSVQGFVEGLLTVLSICAELLVTIFLYTQAVNIIDLLIRIVQEVVRVILNVFNSTAGGTVGAVNDPETYSIMSGLLSTLIILWGTFQLLKWRQAITLTIKSMLTHVLNTVFGTSAEMPTGASTGMMKAAAGVAAGAMVAGALADQGTLDDVVNDLTDSDLGSDVHDKLSEGDYEGAMQDVKDYANGTYPRGRSATADAEAALGDGSGGVGGANDWQSLTDSQLNDLRNDDTYGDDAIAAAEQDVSDAEKALADGTGTQEDVDEAQSHLDDLRSQRAEAAQAMRAENYQKAKDMGVADYGDYLRSQDEADEAAGLQPVEGADIPAVPKSDGKPANLDNDAQMAYTAARDGDQQTLRTASKIYDSNGLTKEQADKVNQAIVDNPDMSEKEVAQMIDGFAQENFGDDHEAVVDKINEASGRDAMETYGSSDNSDGNARTVSVARARGGKGQYKVNDNSSDAEAADASVEASDLPTASMSTEATQQAYDAVRSGNVSRIKAAAGNFDGNGLTGEQHAEINAMTAAGADPGQIQSKIDEFAKQNFGQNADLVIDKMNEAKGVSGTETYSARMDNSPGFVRSITAGGASDSIQESITAAGGGGNVAVGNGGGGQQSGMMLRKEDVAAAGGMAAMGYTMAGGFGGSVAPVSGGGSYGVVQGPAVFGPVQAAPMAAQQMSTQMPNAAAAAAVQGMPVQAAGGTTVVQQGGVNVNVQGGPGGGISGSLGSFGGQQGDVGGGHTVERITTSETIREGVGGGIGDLSQPFVMQAGQNGGQQPIMMQMPNGQYMPIQPVNPAGNNTVTYMPTQAGGQPSGGSVNYTYEAGAQMPPAGTAEDLEKMAGGGANVSNYNTYNLGGESGGEAAGPSYDEYGYEINPDGSQNV